MFWRWLTHRKRPPAPAAPPPSPPLESAPPRHGVAPPSRSASLPYRAAPPRIHEVRPPSASPLARASLSELLKVLLYLDDTFLSLDHVVTELRRHAGAAAALAQMALDPRVPSEPREAAVSALGMLDASPDAVVPALIEALADPETQGAAMRALVHVGARARAAIPALEEIAQKGRADPSAEARWCLLELDLERRAAHIDALFDTIVRGREGAVDPEERRAFRLAAARVASRLGAEAEGGVDALLDRLTNPDEETAGTAANALGQVRARAAEVVPSWQAAEALGRLGLTSDHVVEALVRALSDECPNTRRAAAVSLCQLRVRVAEPALRAMIAREPQAYVREGAEEALGLLFGASGASAGRRGSM
jgi:HEAT repeat protein